MIWEDPGRVQSRPRPAAAFAYQHGGVGGELDDYVPSLPYWVTSLDILQKHAAGVGSVNTNPDSDGVTRYVPLFVRVPPLTGAESAKEEPYRGSLATEALRVAQGSTTYQVKLAGASEEMLIGRGIAKIKIGDIIAPTAANGSILLYDSGHQAARFSRWPICWNPAFDTIPGRGTDHLYRHVGAGSARPEADRR